MDLLTISLNVHKQLVCRQMERWSNSVVTFRGGQKWEKSRNEQKFHNIFLQSTPLLCFSLMSGFWKTSDYIKVKCLFLCSMRVFKWETTTLWAMINEQWLPRYWSRRTGQFGVIQLAGWDDIESLLTSPIDVLQCFAVEGYILLRACSLFLVFNSKQFLF